MATELKSTVCMAGEVPVTRFYGGSEQGTCLQLSFPRPQCEKDRPDYGWWYATFTKEQALDVAAALIEFANDKREETF